MLYFNSETYNQAYVGTLCEATPEIKNKKAVILRAWMPWRKAQTSWDFKRAGAPNPSDPFSKEERKRSLEADSAPKKAPIRTELHYDTKTKVEAINKISKIPI